MIDSSVEVEPNQPRVEASESASANRAADPPPTRLADDPPRSSGLADAAGRLLRYLPPKLGEPAYYRLWCGRAGDPAVGNTMQVPLRYGPAGSKINVLAGDVIGDAIRYLGFYERFTTRALVRMAKQEGGLLVDVGANCGYYSVLWCLLNEQNRCESIEAAPRNLELLRANIADNHLGDRCRVHACAASNAPGTVSFDQGPVKQTGWGGISQGVGSGTRVITVPAERIDTLLESEQPIRLLKLDVEGAEALVIEGLEELLARQSIAEIWFEDCLQRRELLGLTLEQLFAPLERNGYRVLTKSADGTPLPMDYVAVPN